MLENAQRAARELVDAGHPREDGRARRDEPRLQVQRLGDARRAAAHGTRSEGRGEGLGGARAARPSRQGREVVRAAAGNCRGRGADAGRDPEGALRPRAGISQSAIRPSRRIMASSRRPSKRDSRSAWWCGGGECEEKIKEETKATMRCIPLEQPGRVGQVHLLRPAGATDKAIFAQSVLARPSSRRHDAYLSCVSCQT